MLIVTKHSPTETGYNFFESDGDKKKSALKRFLVFKKEIEGVFRLAEKSKEKKNSFYWSLGVVISEFLKKNKIEEKKLVFDVFESATSVFNDIDPDFAKNDHKRKRIMAHHFYLLSFYPKQLVIKTSWSTWTYLFQNTYLSELPGFHNYLSNKMNNSGQEFKEGFLRVFCLVSNSLFNKCDVGHWKTESVLSVINFSYTVTEKLSLLFEIESRGLRKVLVEKLKPVLKKFILFSLLLSGSAALLSLKKKLPNA